MSRLIVLMLAALLGAAGPVLAQDATDRPQGMAGQGAPQPQPPPGLAPPTATPGPGQTSTVPASQDACIAAAQALYQTAEGRRLADAQRDRLEELLVRMEAHCAARQFQEASAIAGDIRVMIEGN